MGTIYLIRHGAAMFGAADYDSLSRKGEEQAALLGRELRQRGVEPDRVFTGTMLRHKQTAAGALKTLGLDLPHEADERWNEYDHEQVIHRYNPDLADRAKMLELMAGSDNPRRTFHQMFTAAVDRWTSGNHNDYDESWFGFRDRVAEAVTALPGKLDKGQTALVFSSGGTIASACGTLLQLDTAATIELHWSIANASITKLRYRDNKVSLLSLNEHGYLEANEPNLLTFR